MPLFAGRQGAQRRGHDVEGFASALLGGFDWSCRCLAGEFRPYGGGGRGTGGPGRSGRSRGRRGRGRLPHRTPRHDHHRLPDRHTHQRLPTMSSAPDAYFTSSSFINSGFTSDFGMTNTATPQTLEFVFHPSTNHFRRRRSPRRHCRQRLPLPHLHHQQRLLHQQLQQHRPDQATIPPVALSMPVPVEES